jgi:hypothetical protein
LCSVRTRRLFSEGGACKTPSFERLVVRESGVESKLTFTEVAQNETDLIVAYLYDV